MKTKHWFIIIGIILAVVFGTLGLKMLFQPVDTVIKSVDMTYDVTDELLDADKAIYNYEWFKQQEADIRRLHQQEQNHQTAYDDYLAVLPEDKTDWDWQDKQELSRLRANVTAQQDMVNKAIEDYNASSSMVSRNIFKNNLPSNISRGLDAGSDLIFQ